MSSRAHVSSIDALRTFRAAVLKFIDAADKAVSEAESELQRVQDWLTNDRPVFWKGELRRREQDVARARDELRRVQWTIGDHKPAAVEQKKALKKAEGRLEEARQKIAAVQRWRVLFDRAVNEYKGQIQPCRTAYEVELPEAAALLSSLAGTLDEYLALAPAELEGELRENLEQAPPSSAALPFLDRPKPAQRAAEAATVARAIAMKAVVLDQKARQHLEILREVSDFVVAAGHPKGEVIPVFDRLKAEREAPRPGDLVVYEDGALLAEAIFLHRLPEKVAGDSGWYVGSLVREDDAQAPRVALGVTASRLLAARPELREIMALPRGWLATVELGQRDRDGQGPRIGLVLDEHERNLWGRGRESGASS